MIVFSKNLIYSQFFLSECYFQMHPVIRSNICFPFNSTRTLGMGLRVHSPCEPIVILVSFCPCAWSICHVPSGQQLTHTSYYGPRLHCELLKTLPYLSSRMKRGLGVLYKPQSCRLLPLFCISRGAGCCAKGFLLLNTGSESGGSICFCPSLLRMFSFSLVIKHAMTSRIIICRYYFSLEAEIGKINVPMQL